MQTEQLGLLLYVWKETCNTYTHVCTCHMKRNMACMWIKTYVWLISLFAYTVLCKRNTHRHHIYTHKDWQGRLASTSFYICAQHTCMTTHTHHECMTHISLLAHMHSDLLSPEAQEKAIHTHTCKTKTISHAQHICRASHQDMLKLIDEQSRCQKQQQRTQDADT